MDIDSLDRSLLNIIQSDFPIEAEPYKALASKLETTEEIVLSRLKKLMENGVIRRLGAIFDSRKMGYIGTLCALKVIPERVEEVARIINNFPGVTHNYLREHEYNMWFTLLGTSEDEISGILEEIISLTGIKDIINLPSKKLYKIKVNFKMSEGK